MKLLVLIGGFAGFAIGIVFGLLAGSSWLMVIWHACLATYLSALLVRWWSQVWMRNLQQSCRERIATSSNQPRPPTLPQVKP